MATGNQTNITPPRVSLIDERTGAVSREWYRWFYSLFTTLGSGTGIIPVDSGGTGLGTIPTNGQLLIGNGTGYSLNTLGTGAGISVTNGLGTIVVANTGVLSFSAGTTGLTPSVATTGAVTLAGKLVIANGGTNSTSTPTAGAVPYGTGTAYAFTAAGTAGQVLTSAGAGVPIWTTPTTGTVTSVAATVPAFLSVAGSPITTTGTLAISLSGTALPVANGGTGVTTSTGTTNVVLSNSPTLVTPALGTPSSGVVTNLTGTASININGTVGATTPAAGSFTNITGSANAIISVTDNTNAALRITQLGTGNALLVEDSANPDSTPFVINASGSVGINTTAPAAKLNVAGTTIISNVDVLSATYDSVSFSVAAEEINPNSLFFSADGSKMFVTGTSGDDVNEYVLSTPWVVSSATYSTVFSISAQDTSPQGLFFRADGLKMYLVGATNDTVFQYALTSPWSVATASYESLSFSVAAQDLTPTGIFFKPNGLSMYVVGNINDNVNQYTLSTAWNVSTATFLQAFSVAGQEGSSQDISFTGDGTRMSILGATGDDVNVYNLTTPWDISTASSVGAFSIAGQETTPTGLFIKPDGTKMYVVGTNMDTVFQYTVPSVEIQLTGTTSINGSATVAQDLTVNGDFNTSGSITSTSNLTFTGTGNRITGDFSNATFASRVTFQTSTVDGATDVQAIPNGTGTRAGFIAYNNSSIGSATANTQLLQLSTETRLVAGGSSPLPMTFYAGGSERMRLDTSGNVLVTSAAGLGYGTGSGGTVTQATDKSTAVTLNKPTGQITMNAAALLANTNVSFTLNNSLLSATDTLLVHRGSAGSAGVYFCTADGVGAGSCSITVRNTSASSLSEAIVLNFAIIKGASS